MVLLACSVFQLDLVSGTLCQFYTFSKQFQNGFVYFQQISNPNFTIVMILIAVLTGLVFLFLFCYSGKLATESYENMTHCLFESNWFEFITEISNFDDSKCTETNLLSWFWSCIFKFRNIY